MLPLCSSCRAKRKQCSLGTGARSRAPEAACTSATGAPHFSWLGSAFGKCVGKCIGVLHVACISTAQDRKRPPAPVTTAQHDIMKFLRIVLGKLLAEKSNSHSRRSRVFQGHNFVPHVGLGGSGLPSECLPNMRALLKACRSWSDLAK